MEVNESRRGWRMSAIAHQLESIVGSEAVETWDKWEPTIQTHILSALWSATPTSTLVYPNTQAELAEVITCAHRDRWRVLICGSGSKLSWGGLTQADIVVSTARLNRLIDHAVGDLTVTAEAGIPFATLQTKLAEANQFLAIDPLYSHRATLGGIVATADTQALRHRYGGIRDMLIGISLVRADGQPTKAGGRVVKNVAGYDLMKLLTGSYGTLGIISQVTFRVYPRPETTSTVLLVADSEAMTRLGNSEAIAQATQTLIASALTPTAVELISSQLSDRLGYGAAIALVVQFQSIAVSVEKQVEHLMQLGKALELKAIVLDSSHQHTLWQVLQKPMEPDPTDAAIVGKLGVLPTHASQLLDKMSRLIPDAECFIHAGSGLGMVQCKADTSLTNLTALRQLCETHQGFLTILKAPIAIKQQFDLWGYPGNALTLMQKLKDQFDPHSILNPNRFVNGI